MDAIRSTGDVDQTNFPDADAISAWHAHRLQALSASQAAAGERLLAAGRWRPPHHADMQISIAAFQACTERSLLWTLHQLSFLRYLLARDVVHAASDGAVRGMAFAAQWWACYGDMANASASEAWHDHATALRLQNLLLLRSCLRQAGLAIGEIDHICTSHADVLAREDFYNKGNNHGLDQSMALFEFAGEFGHKAYLDLAQDRIAFEVGNAFASDGGHVENSPAYQNYGLIQARRVAALGKAYLGYPIGLDPELLSRAELALAHMTRPDNRLPHIGDTVDYLVTGQVRPDDTALVLPDSGWAMMRTNWTTQATHVVLKCGFQSGYHRHDDDLAISLFGRGEEWIIDAGMYKHHPGDPLRIYARSAKGHSLPMPVRASVSRQKDEVGAQSRIVSHTIDAETVRLEAETAMFRGYHASRRIVFNRQSGQMEIVDRVEPVTEEQERLIAERAQNGQATYLTRFLLPQSKRVTRLPGVGVILRGRRSRLLIETDMIARLVTGHAGDPVAGWRAVQQDKIEPAVEMTFMSRDLRYEARFRLRWLREGEEVPAVAKAPAVQAKPD